MSKDQENEENLNDKKRPKSGETLQALTQISQMGITMAAAVFIGVFIGKYLDRFLGTGPWLLLFFSLVGAGAAIKVLFNMSGNKK